MNVYERIQMLRKEYLKLTQEEFASKIKISRSNLGSIEIGRISVTDRVVNDICLSFGVNEVWLRTGCGEMYVDDDAVTVAQVVEKYRLDRLDCKIIEAYLNLTETQRNVFKEYARSLVDAVLSDDNYEDYRETYIKENAAPMAARHGDVDGLQEVANLYDNADREKQDK